MELLGWGVIDNSSAIAGRSLYFGAGDGTVYAYESVRRGIVGDMNGDGNVDMKDIGYVARRFMCALGDPLWDPVADLNSDGKIDRVDIDMVAKHFGEHYPQTVF